jgi:hypothetical protein
MLRVIVLLLVLANLAWWAAGQGWLPAGWLPWATTASQREPQRLAALQRPETIRILPPAADRPGAPRSLAPAPEAAPAATETAWCLEAGPFTAAQWPAAEAAIESVGLTATAWRRVAAEPAVAPAGGDWLRVPAADGFMRERLLAMNDPRLAAGFHDCR